MSDLTKYEYEKQIAKSLPALDDYNLVIASKNIAKFLDENKNAKYLMLLSDELRYYTIFNIDNKVKLIKGIAEDILRFLQRDSFLGGIGKLKLIEVNEDHIEIWIGETYFSLFVADSFFVNI